MMAAVIRAYREYWDEMLAVGLGVVVTDVAGNTVKSWIGPFLEQAGLGQWADPLSEFLIGAGALAISEMFLSGSMKVYGRLAAFGATAVAVADVVATLMGAAAPAPARPAPRPAVRPPAPARPAPARPAVTVMPRPAAPKPAPAAPAPKPAAPAPEKAPKIFGS